MKAVDDNLTLISEIHGHFAPDIALDLPHAPIWSVRVPDQHTGCEHCVQIIQAKFLSLHQHGR